MDRDTSKEVIDGKIEKPHFCDLKTIFEHVHCLAKKVELVSKDKNHAMELMEGTVPKAKYEELEKKVDMALMRMNVLESERENEGVISMKALLQEMQRMISNQNKKIEGQAHDCSGS